LIQAIRFDKGKVHDFDMYKKAKLDISDELEMNADSGFEGIQKLHKKVNLPQKASKLKPLTESQKKQNTKKHLNEFLLNISIVIVKYLKYVGAVTEENIKTIKILG
jgi:hypothetical protein